MDEVFDGAGGGGRETQKPGDSQGEETSSVTYQNVSGPREDAEQFVASHF